MSLNNLSRARIIKEIQRGLNIRKSINLNQHIKKKNCTGSSICAENTFDRFQLSFLRTLSKIGIKRSILTLKGCISYTYRNIIFSGKI